MIEMQLPWLELAILIPLAGAIYVARQKDPDAARQRCLVVSSITLAFSAIAAADFLWLHNTPVTAESGWGLMSSLLDRPCCMLDNLSAPMLPMLALLYLLTTIATLRTKVRRFSFAWNLVSESIVLALFSCQCPWGIVTLLTLGTVPPFLELRARGKSTAVFALHMAVFIGLLVLGCSIVELEGPRPVHTLWAVAPLILAVCLRNGVFPLHCWMTDLFEHASFGTALLFVAPLPGVYAALRLVLPIAPEWTLHWMGWISLITAFYAAGMALVQRDARRFFCYLFLSHAALVFVGLDSANSIGLTGALCVWLSIGLALSGFGLAMRALEARLGRLSLNKFHGVYEHTPALAICFLLTGLASVGFPGTFGFIGAEMLVDGAVQAYPYVGIAVVIVSALNGIAVVQNYFVLFTGTRHASTVWLGISLRERFAVLTLAVIILGGGLFPQLIVTSRHHAAVGLLNSIPADREPGHETHAQPTLSQVSGLSPSGLE